MTTQLAINGPRLWDTIMASARIGPGRIETGLRRLALTDADREMRDLFVRWCRDAGCAVTIDRMGSIFARRAGTDDSLPPVLIGSHLDTQIAGGRFDGILGVLAGLEVIRTLNDAGVRTRRPIELVSWTNEEGARFAPPMLASAVFAGVRPLEWALARVDADGRTVGEELSRIGYAGAAPVGGRPVDAYFELHIEQGPILDDKGIPVGVVTGGFEVRGVVVEVRGETAHAGPTPMAQRRNAPCKHDEATIARALQGHWRDEPLFALAQAMARYDVYHQKIAECDRDIEASLQTFADRSEGQPLPPAPRPRKRGRNQPAFAVRAPLHRITGVDLTQSEGIDETTSLVILSEIGLDMRRWPTVKHCTSWLGLCPHHRVSGGTVLRRRTKPCANRAATALRLAAACLHHGSATQVMLADALVLRNLLHLNMISTRKPGQSITCLSLPRGVPGLIPAGHCSQRELALGVRAPPRPLLCLQAAQAGPRTQSSCLSQCPCRS
jgi:hypothetical protein